MDPLAGIVGVIGGSSILGRAGGTRTAGIADRDGADAGEASS